jgi:mannose-6-phosphate isomerase-like protein (cupin superfamily)
MKAAASEEHPTSNDAPSVTGGSIIESWTLSVGRWTFARMTILNIASNVPFTTKDGSTIRSILDRANAPVKNQSLAEATVPTGCATQRHHHRLSEEFYFILEGRGKIEIDGEQRAVAPGDAILIPAGCWHTITAESDLRFLCCCAPPYSHEDTYF